MNFKTLRKWYLSAFCLFLIIMLLFTLISRGIYTSGLPQVQTASPISMALEHEVTLIGTLEPDSVQAAYAVPGLRIKQVHVKSGDLIEIGDLLFTLEETELENLCTAQQQTVRRLQLQIKDLESAKKINADAFALTQQRALEDYNANVSSAQAVTKNAEQRLLQHNNAKPAITAEADRQTARDNYANWTTQLSALETQEKTARQILTDALAALEEAQGRPDISTEELNTLQNQVDTAQSSLDAASTALLECKQNAPAIPDFSAEDSALQQWLATKESLETELKNAKQSETDIITQSSRSLEDAYQPKPSDSSLQLLQMDLDEAQKQLDTYLALSAQGGHIYSNVRGIILSIEISVGQCTNSEPILMTADLTHPFLFRASLSKEQKLYVNTGVDARLTLDGQIINCVVDYLIPDDAETYTLLSYLPEGIGSIAQSGTLSVSTTTEIFNCCIPLNALYMDTLTEEYYVYVLSEKEGILGTELSATAVSVTLLDKNESFAAISSQSVDSHTYVITDSTKPLSNHCPIRLLEN